ncbi:hypothetical protein [Rhodopila sp.]
MAVSAVAVAWAFRTIGREHPGRRLAGGDGVAAGAGEEQGG